jgi:hypothetical protein
MAGDLETLEQLRSEDDAAGRLPEVVAALKERMDDLCRQAQKSETFIAATPA